MEIFDVSRTDPSLLVVDQLGVNYSQDQVIRPNTSSDNLALSTLHPGRLRHSSEPVMARKKIRHHSGPLPSHSSFKGDSWLYTDTIIIEKVLVCKSSSTIITNYNIDIF